MSRFSVIIVSWNALDHLQTFLPSVVNTNYSDFEIILADNASDDGSAGWVRSTYPEIKIATFDRNYGYCGGNNRAVPYADGDVLVFLNNDVKVDPDWLTHLEACFKKNEPIAAVQPKLRSFEKPDYFEYAGAAGGYLDRYGYPFCQGRIFDTVEKDTGQYDDETDILWASGAALAVRRELFVEFGGFDEDFEFHMEEIDLCWRLINHGYRVRYCPDSVVYHLGGGSLAMGSPRKVFYNFRNNLFMLWKNYSSSSLRRRFPIRILLDALAALYELKNGHFRAFGAILRGHWHFYRTIGKTHAKRKRLQSCRKNVNDPETMVNKSIVVEYFARKKHRFQQLFQ